MRRFIIIALFFEVGVVLVVVPWVPYWRQNFFIDSRPYIEDILTNDFVKGAISGLGLVNLFAGIAELASVFMSRRTPAADEASTSIPDRDRSSPPASIERDAPPLPSSRKPEEGR